MVSSICFGVVFFGKYFFSLLVLIFKVSFWLPFSSVIIAVLSTGDSGYTKEINLISWNGKEPKYDIRSFSPNREKCGKGITLNADEAAALLKALQKELNSED